MARPVTPRSARTLFESELFRGDLHFPLNTGYSRVPPLRERLCDILPLARLFLCQANARYGKSFASITRDTVHLLEEHTRPGNVRELKSQIDRIVLKHDGRHLTAGHLGLTVERENDLGQHDRIVLELPEEGHPLEDMQATIARTILKRIDGNITKAARSLDVARATLNRMSGLRKSGD
ncbi:MAG: hypothetical protein KC488_03530 [Candidatus Cloacimonetes bacterium]|nr:hypothetical protein [Candidatus Cloacimonadota bacterium]